MLHALRSEIEGRPVLKSLEALTSYLRALMAHSAREEVRVLYLDAARHLIADEIAAMGTVTEASVYPREIMRRALNLGAAGLIVVHNHPSGNPAPSRDDISLTRRLCEAGAALDVIVHDHVIVARAGLTSFRATGLL